MTINEKKKLIKNYLNENGLTYTKVTARTIGFSDLARTRKVFVKISGWQPSPKWDEIRKIAYDNDFCIES